MASQGAASRRPGEVWLDAAPQPRRASRLARATVVIATVELLDLHGVGRLTMRQVASRLGVTATALYWHVRNRDELLDLAFDHIFGDVPLPPPSGDWKGDARQLLRAWREAMLEHPWSPMLVGRPAIGPNVLSRTEFLHATLARAGLSDDDLAAASHVLANYVVGVALNDATWRQAAGTNLRVAARAHLTSQGDRYPMLTRHGHLDEQKRNDEELFLTGLDAILEGVNHARDPHRARQ